MGHRHRGHRHGHHHKKSNYRNADSHSNSKQNNASSKKSMTMRYKILIGMAALNVLLFSPLSPLIILADIIFVIFWIWGNTKNCPRCKSHWARKLMDRSHFGSHTEFETRHRTVVHRDKFGNEIGSSSIPMQKAFNVSTIQNHWRCKYCGNTWSGRVHDVRN